MSSVFQKSEIISLFLSSLISQMNTIHLEGAANNSLEGRELSYGSGAVSIILIEFFFFPNKQNSQCLLLLFIFSNLYVFC